MDNETVQIVSDKIGLAIEKLEPIVDTVIEEVVRQGWYRVYFAIASFVIAFTILPTILYFIYKVVKSDEPRMIAAVICGLLWIVFVVISIAESYEGSMQIAAPIAHLLGIAR